MRLETLPDVAADKKIKPIPPYFIGGFETVDRNGCRITTGRDAAANYAMVSASKYEASLVGAEVLEKGGNAIDAAVSMGFVLSVVEPFTSGVEVR